MNEALHFYSASFMKSWLPRRSITEVVAENQLFRNLIGTRDGSTSKKISEGKLGVLSLDLHVGEFRILNEKEERKLSHGDFPPSRKDMKILLQSA